MNLASWANDRATVTVPGTYEERGDVLDDWDAPAAVFPLRGLFEPGPGDVDPDAYAVSITGTFRARGGREVPAKARVDVEGFGTYGLASDGQRVRSATGALNHVLLVLTRWEVR
ncbi:hypothetical protein GCM10009592_26550 [Brachybacterium rhamnosum]|uniref:Head-to-tail stopper n=1 Tax=Brachybacterium rhamnosum TaxID=173361 RepID=A0ABW4Q2Q9_9MICO